MLLLPGVKVGGNAVSRPYISTIRRSQASKSVFSRGNARSQAGKIVLSMETQLVNLNFVKITTWLEIKGPAAKAKLKGSTDSYRSPGIFNVHTTLKSHFSPRLLLRVQWQKKICQQLLSNPIVSKQVSKTWICRAHRHNTSNAITSVRWKQKLFQQALEVDYSNIWSPETVRERVPQTVGPATANVRRPHVLRRWRDDVTKSGIWYSRA